MMVAHRSTTAKLGSRLVRSTGVCQRMRVLRRIGCGSPLVVNSLGSAEVADLIEPSSPATVMVMCTDSCRCQDGSSQPAAADACLMRRDRFAIERAATQSHANPHATDRLHSIAHLSQSSAAVNRFLIEELS